MELWRLLHDCSLFLQWNCKGLVMASSQLFSFSSIESWRLGDSFFRGLVMLLHNCSLFLQWNCEDLVMASSQSFSFL
ncbi:hypothetical protein F8M41_012870 [Gigaspora margarita]|uniref:Uncharacterized protein n=1 Tax=Gigaspora margarita TaxID=4874 RepID=A0A8H3WZ26_GIGMA|nr:hypothetical protein F8M41_012870 [Gigaspora margarita]